jgi:hypothetical protein
MENLTNQVLTLANGKNYLVLRQAAYKGIVYYLGAEVTPDGEDFTNEFIFFERVERDGKFNVKRVTDTEVLTVLAKNIKFE